MNYNMHESEILQLLEQIEIMLEEHQVPSWPHFLAQLKEQFSQAVASRDPSAKRQALEDILGIFGGMGSFNDISIDFRAGHRIKPEQVSTVNRELDDLTDRLYAFVKRASMITHAEDF